MEEKAEGSEMRHIRINTGVVDVWLVKCEVLKCPPQAYAAGSTGKRESEVFYSVMILDGQARMGAQRHATWSRCDPHTRSRRRGETRQEVKKVLPDSGRGREVFSTRFCQGCLERSGSLNMKLSSRNSSATSGLPRDHYEYCASAPVIQHLILNNE